MAIPLLLAKSIITASLNVIDRLHLCQLQLMLLCSGLQILSGLARCKKTAQLVNVLPSDSPQDAYRTVWDACKHEFPERLQPHGDRTVTKRCVMTIPYNAKEWSNRGYIKDAFKEKH